MNNHYNKTKCEY